MTLHLGFELRDFDLERVGFSLSVLDESKKRQISEGYLRMSLDELGAFLNALKAVPQDIQLVMVDGARDMRDAPPVMPPAEELKVAQPDNPGQQQQRPRR